MGAERIPTADHSVQRMAEPERARMTIDGLTDHAAARLLDTGEGRS